MTPLGTLLLALALNAPPAGAAAIAWTDPILTANATKIRQIHIAELRTHANAARVSWGLANAVWTDPTLSASIKARGVHITELRAAVEEIYTVAALTKPAWSDNPIVANVTKIRAAHIIELRKAIEGAQLTLTSHAVPCSGTFTVPARVYKNTLTVELWGGGGSGGGGSTGSGGSGGGGGGAGQYVSKTITVVSGQNFACSIGGGGWVDNAGHPGGDNNTHLDGATGGSTSFGSVATANGGGRGYNHNPGGNGSYGSYGDGGGGNGGAGGSSSLGGGGGGGGGGNKVCKSDSSSYLGQPGGNAGTAAGGGGGGGGGGRSVCNHSGGYGGRGGNGYIRVSYQTY